MTYSITRTYSGRLACEPQVFEVCNGAALGDALRFVARMVDDAESHKQRVAIRNPTSAALAIDVGEHDCLITVIPNT